MKKWIVLLSAVLMLFAAGTALAHEIPDMDTIWALEDARTESAEPLTKRLLCGGSVLAYDEGSNTFFCSVGLPGTEEWPKLDIVSENPYVQVAFVDDYTFDACNAALEDGNEYEIMLYSDDSYFYSKLIFTGFPTLSVFGDEELTTEYSVCSVEFGDSEQPFESSGKIHRRGASTLLREKGGFKIKFTKEPGGKKKKIEVREIGKTNDIILLALSHDDALMRDKLSWQIYGEILGADYQGPFAARRSTWVEFFLNGSYEGVYLMMEPMDVDEEMKIAGGTSPELDGVYRTAALNFARDRDYVKHPYRANAGYELYYSAAEGDREKEFEDLQPYLDLIQTEDDAEFAALAEKLIDIDSMVNMELLVQGGGMTDNIFNNLYIWGHPSDSGFVYRFAPWDMDMTWGLKTEDIGDLFENWMFFPLADRMLSLNVGGIREKLIGRWRALRESTFTLDHLQELLDSYSAQLKGSGAMNRNTVRWNEESPDAEGYMIYSFASVRYPLVDSAMDQLEEQGNPEFLQKTEYQLKGYAIEPQQ